MSPAARLPRSRTWLRTLVLLLALLVPGAAAEVSAAPVAAEIAAIAEYDVVDTALRPAPRAPRPAAPPRPAALPAPAPGVPADRPRPAPSRPSYALHALRTVVLRC
ncbi:MULTISPECIES: hypothetical protein [unclassified Streptomyces]|uniref:hypothetical protein n=1 Tax=unclassified Streptomyces TaxID=2593676 RepID=UPI00070B18FD|nr:hypothetical protein [Streptomyces sp. Root1310]KQX62522.1 hypothetical protein ASD48_28430 [Streptomyces sp. Root1310]